MKRMGRRDCSYYGETMALSNTLKDCPSNNHPPTQQSFGRQKTRVWRLVLGGVLLLTISSNSTQTARLPPGDVAGALGAFTGLLLSVALAVWLIRSGLPKTAGLDKIQRRTRRRIWYGLAGMGLLVMIAVSSLLAYFGLFAAAVLVTWVYWFGWLWICWLIADKKAVQRARPQAIVSSICHSAPI
jgi:hypothetical protein